MFETKSVRIRLVPQNLHALIQLICFVMAIICFFSIKRISPCEEAILERRIGYSRQIDGENHEWKLLSKR